MLNDPDGSGARALLRVAPAEYVAERTRLTKAAKAAGDKALAAQYQSLKRPTLPMWAVLAAAENAKAVRFVMASTTELAETQVGGGNRAALAAATQHRRTAVEALVDEATNALARWEPGAEGRRAEIRSIVDQLSRHPDLTAAWIDGSLRELPDDSLGFTGFGDLEGKTPDAVVRPAKPAKPAKAAKGSKAATRVETAPAPQPRAPVDDAAARAERVAQARQARKDVAAAIRDLTAADRRLEAARTSLREAEGRLRSLEAERNEIQRRHDDATRRVAAATND